MPDSPRFSMKRTALGAGPAAADGGGRTSGRLGQPGRAWPPQRRHGRELLAVPPLCQPRCRPPPSTGANPPSRSICSCASANGKRPRPCGSGATAVAGMDFASGPERCHQAGARRSSAAGAGLAAGARRRTRRVLSAMDGAASASRLSLTASARADVRRTMPAARAAARRRSRAAPSWSGSAIFWMPARSKRDAQAVARRRVGHLVRIVDPAEEDFPYSGRTRFEMPPRAARDEIFGRAERVRARLSRPLRRPWRSASPMPLPGWAGPAPPTAPITRRKRADRAACRHRRRC